MGAGVAVIVAVGDSGEWGAGPAGCDQDTHTYTRPGARSEVAGGHETASHPGKQCHKQGRPRYNRHECKGNMRIGTVGEEGKDRRVTSDGPMDPKTLTDGEKRKC